MYNWKVVEKEVQTHWKKNKIPEKIVEFDLKSEKKKFYLLDGPPYVNGIPHVGHAMTTVFKDIWGKFKFMQGHQVWFQPGFDCGGLPIENKVEQELGIKNKNEIEEKIGVTKFIEECKKFASGNERVWMDYYKRIAAWRGWFSPAYRTSENYYLESGWWTVKKWYEKGLFVEGMRPGFWCTHCETVLAGIEASESYKDVTDPSVYLKFKVRGRKNEYLLVFTTTPWTLPANVAVLVHPDEKYVRVKVGEDVFIIAKSLSGLLDGLGYEFEVIETFNGDKLEGIKYEPILEVPAQEELEKDDKAHRVYVSVPVMKRRVASKQLVKKESSEGRDEFGHIVTVDVGTGLVHIAPGHGDVDNKIGKHYGLQEISPVNEKGCLTEEAGKFSQKYVKDADREIIADLRKRGRLLHYEPITHSYPLCWRCKTPLIFRMSRQWFLKIDGLRNKIISANQKKVKWLPEFARERYHNVIFDAPDWAVTRQRYWGIPLPLWQCERCERQLMVGSREELRELSTKTLPKDFDLHKHVVDKVRLKCECGGEMLRDKDIMDVWFDSGIAPWASLGYPFKNKELFERLWGVDLVDESQDQVKSWFNTLMISSFATFDKEPYQTVCLNGWALDEKGDKMSKSLGNMILAQDAYETLGADVLRLYLCYDIAPWETHRFSLNGAEKLSKVVNVIQNVSNLIKMYSIDYPKMKEDQLNRVENQWVISRLNSLIRDVTDDLDNFRFHFVGRKLSNFILNDFSRTYLKLVKDVSHEKEVQFTVNRVYSTYLKLLSPLMSFLCEKLYLEHYSKVEGVESVHLAAYPEFNAALIDEKLEEEMQIVEDVVESANAIRQKHNLRLRWPLKEIKVSGGKQVKIAVERFSETISYLANVKGVRFSESIPVKVVVKPNYRVLGRKFGKDTSKVVRILSRERPEKLEEKLQSGGVEISKFKITPEMVLVQKEFSKSESDKDSSGKTFRRGVILLNTKRDRKLEEEAFIREFVRVVQTERKKLGLKLDQKIILSISKDPVLERWKKEIGKNVAVKRIEFGGQKLGDKVEIQGKIIRFGIKK